MKIIIHGDLQRSTFNAHDIPVGTTFSGVIDGNHSLYLKAFLVVIDLENPNQLWTTRPHASVTVYEYQPRNVELHDKGPVT